ncbi:MAG: hypothetical protein HY919_00600 [Elusimicrobia bacterium]|nr:hypothetical protein [Elusimicrobiota bacterium]
MEINSRDKCILMFSGGRDSTISAVRLSKIFTHLTLVTVTSEHLVGIEQVYQRVIQIKKYLPKGTEWLQVFQPKFSMTETINNATCLPCQSAYISVGIILAQKFQISNLAMGYSGYQNSWPEQTPYATTRLKKLMEDIGLRFHLPVYDIQKKEDAINELVRLGLEPESYEQKCLKQTSNIELEEDILRSEIDRWINCITEIIKSKDNVTAVNPIKLD